MSTGSHSKPGSFAKRTYLIAGAAILVILMAGISIFTSLRPRRPGIHLEPFEGIGLVAAEETARILGQRGKILVVTVGVGADGVGGSPFHAQLDAFQKTIRQYDGLSVEAVERMDQAAGRSSGPGMGIPRDQYTHLLDTYPDVDAVVSLVGPPHIADEDIGRLPPKRPRLVVVSTLGWGVRRLLESGVIHVAVVPRAGSEETDGPEPQSPREWFTRYYQIVTPDQASVLPN